MQNIRKYLVGSLLLSCLVDNQSAKAQTLLTTEPPTPHVERALTAVSLNYLGLAISQERGISTQATVLYGVGAHYSFYSTGSPILGTRFIEEIDKYFGRDYSVQRLTPYLFVGARLYTTLDKRAVRGRSTSANSANYLAVVGEIPFATGNLINVPNLALAYPVGVQYGLRRPLGSCVYFEGSIGAFLKLSSVQQSLQPRLDFSLAWHP